MLCKHVAAVLYGVGARLDEEPELLFPLRGVDDAELVARATVGLTRHPARERSVRRAIADDRLSAVFGIDLELAPAPRARRPIPRADPGRSADPVARMIVTAHAVTEQVTQRRVTKRRHRGSVRSACTGENSIRRWSPLLGPVTSTYLQTRTPTARVRWRSGRAGRPMPGGTSTDGARVRAIILRPRGWGRACRAASRRRD